MTTHELAQLHDLLTEYANSKTKACNYDCRNCELGVLEGYGYGYSCAIDIVSRNVGNELRSN